MGSGRFGPIRQKQEENSRKQRGGKNYTVDYNRLVTFLMVVVIAVLAVIMYFDWKGKKDAGVQLVNVPTPEAGPAFLQTPAPSFTPSPEQLRPMPEAEGLLPIFNMANTGEKRIAITVGGLTNSKNLSTLIGLCATYDAKITFFPTGEEITKNMNAWGEAVLAGHEIESPAYSASSFEGLSKEDMLLEIQAQTNLLRNAIGADYQPHFLRPGDMADDLNPELHALLAQEGYFGIARWRVHTPGSLSEVEPGAILAYTLNDSGLRALSAAIPILSENGFEMVTMNELFAYPGNFPEGAAG